jgi:hypothetical protein
MTEQLPQPPARALSPQSIHYGYLFRASLRRIEHRNNSRIVSQPKQTIEENAAP